jgi:peptidoglycan/xylan/chitin deacetylase (PgdA/CDA1 family)
MEGLVWTAAALAGLGFSARYTWWRARLKGVPIFMYHHITDELKGTPLPKLRVSPRRFARQLDIIKKAGFQAVTLSRALSADAPAKPCVISFDDGYDNFLTNAWPLLKERGMSATVFLVTAEIGGSNRWDLGKGEPQEAMLNREQVLDLARQGVEFGGHTRDHLNLTTLNRAELAEQIRGCQEDLTRLLGSPARVFSYPFGAFDQKSGEMVKQAGFDFACTTRPGKAALNTPPFELPRIIVKRADDSLDFRIKLSRAKSRL